ncbi:16S rRNA (cytidine1402-2'-O)-methyltransferase [Aequitasia blattaphilus]|uniref:Ribosomal RNA small subunit methyltransferase I n=1 Tax=Aequitasia blattaphilus TaxID=2949332 RepID=A0ABT1E9G0_9FIRM|nr:16S rRNA (cytidine(1402)-2'-O)-methyltransferase [Aequitasia blattaphilus]MCP1102470.1 16S rRNA (cytidine(1402)-2'-O)-methyltransferase [Aequitasia blattaphilus]MCR8615110.1 16S rRNA (cytidine(1402)-2'-O)-methyltransferase [Aequitasia blattaphilus]
MRGILYLCGTPIGNLEDITLRALNILKEADAIAAEDTRNTKRLLNHYEIQTPLTSYHEHNKYDKGRILIEMLNEGKSIALVTDAGMPGISDPGEELVKMCIEEGIEVTTIPGPTAFVSALILSGLSSRRFVFEAFLPRDKKERREVLNGLKNETRTIILYEAPHRLARTLKELEETLGNRKAAVVRELTKKFEEAIRMNLTEIIQSYEETPPKGECVIVLEGKSKEEVKKESIEMWEQQSIEEHMNHYLKKNYAQKDAMKAVAKDRGISKRDVYKHLLADKEDE